MSRENTNAKEEFLRAIRNRTVKCASIGYSPCSLWGMSGENPPQKKKVVLKIGYNETDWENFLQELDFGYDSGYGGQELFGIVWFKDNGEWMDRGEFDGSEWWQIQSIPQIPQDLY